MRLATWMLAVLPTLAAAAVPDQAQKKTEGIDVIPNLTVDDSAAAIAFCTKAFGANEQFRFPTQDGKHVLYAEVKIGDSVVALGDGDPATGEQSPTSLGGTAVTLTLRNVDVDPACQRAIGAGATLLAAPADMSWGGRYAAVTDPFGHRWAFVGPLSTEARQTAPAAQPGAKDAAPTKPDSK